MAVQVHLNDLLFVAYHGWINIGFVIAFCLASLVCARSIFRKTSKSPQQLKRRGVSHLGIIMDGNRRYGRKSQNHTPESKSIENLCVSILQHAALQDLLPPNNANVLQKLKLLQRMIRFTPLDGHRKGAERLKSCIEDCASAGVEMLTVYAFSTENWNRTPCEVNVIMAILLEVLYEFEALSIKNGIFVRFISTDVDRLPSALLELMKTVEEKSRQIRPRHLTLNVLLSYSGQSEIAAACDSMIKERLFNHEPSSATRVTVEEVKRHLLRSISQPAYETEDEMIFATTPLEPQLIIRTGGERRMSNFMLFECAYSELFFSDKTWPEFQRIDLQEAFDAYSKRQKRWGQ